MLDNTDFARMVKVFRYAALLAGQAIKSIYGQNDLAVETKADASPVTLADRVADGLLRHVIRDAYPQTLIVTEEHTDSHTQKANGFHLIDPLDGTREFIESTPEFTVNIAYIHNNKPLCGVIYAPALDRLFYTNAMHQCVEEQAPFDLYQAGTTRCLSPKPVQETQLTLATSKRHENAVPRYLDGYRIKHTLHVGSSLKFCLLAAGEADVYPRLGRTMEWDTAAGQAILEAAGGYVINTETRAALVYGKNNYANPSFVAYRNGLSLTF